jgi:hypothetical protein
MDTDAATELYEKITSLDGFDEAVQIAPEVQERCQLAVSAIEAASDGRLLSHGVKSI